MWASTIQEVDKSIELFDVSVNKDVKNIGQGSLRKTADSICIYFTYYRALSRNKKLKVVIVPLSQSIIGFVRDSLFLLISRLTGKEAIVYLHGSEFYQLVSDSGWIFKRYVKYILKYPKSAIVLGRSLRQNFSRWFPEERIFVVENGISMPKSVKHRDEKSSHSFSILCISNMMPRKGLLDVLAAFRLLVNNGMNMDLHIAGARVDSAIAAEVDRFQSDYPLSVKYQGVVDGDTKADLFNTVDVFVFTPREPEGMPYVVIEALAYGLPIVTTDQGAITESVINSVNGIIVEAKNVQSIASALEYLYYHPEERRMMGCESRRIFEEKHTAEGMVKKIHDVVATITE